MVRIHQSLCCYYQLLTISFFPPPFPLLITGISPSTSSTTTSPTPTSDVPGALPASGSAPVVGSQVPSTLGADSSPATDGPTRTRRTRRRRTNVTAADDSLPSESSSPPANNSRASSDEAPRERQASTGTTSTTPRGRPPRRSTQRLCPTTGDIADDIIDSGAGNPTDFSLTVSSRESGNIPLSVFDDVSHFLEKRASRGVVSLERGAERGNLHVQGVITLGIVKEYDSDRKLNADVRNAIKSFEDWTPELRLKIDVKPLGNKQSFEGEKPFLRYCLPLLFPLFPPFILLYLFIFTLCSGYASYNHLNGIVGITVKGRRSIPQFRCTVSRLLRRFV